MDKMTFCELNDIIINIPYLDRNLWESARLNSYIIAQVNSKKTIKPTDILKFKWDNENEGNAEEQKISNEDIKRLKERSKQIGRFITH